MQEVRPDSKLTRTESITLPFMAAGAALALPLADFVPGPPMPRRNGRPASD